jgi:diguanylate cyclase (GGDEF)-like protein
LLLFDLDRFKDINDRHGHAVGDSVLTAFCATALEQLRLADLFVRMGGEEFACLLPGVTAFDALGIAERIRLVFETTIHTVGEEHLSATVSVGLAVGAAERTDLPSLLVRADRALYRAKNAGENRVASEENPASGGRISKGA